MDREQIKASLAPCGLSCERCFAYVDGDIRRLSQELEERLGNFAPYAERYVTLLEAPVFDRYSAVRELLDFFAAENCRGCRNESCRLFRDCGVRSCHQEKQVDFCCECDAFPCDRTRFPEALYNAWVRINGIMREKASRPTTG